MTPKLLWAWAKPEQNLQIDQNIGSDIFTSFRAMPILVQIWLRVILVPVNMASLLFGPPVAEGNYAVYLYVLLITTIISFLFDFPDAVKWIRGDRVPSRPKMG